MSTPTYTEVGATAGDLPAGYHHLRACRPLGRGDACFDEAVRRLFTWQAHRAAGVRRMSGAERVDLGVEVTFRFLGLRVPCLVVAVVDDPNRRGFAYGTLPGHPETGEERFSVVRDPATGHVSGEVVAFSRPVAPLLRLAGPLGPVGQRVMAHRYLAALRC